VSTHAAADDELEDADGDPVVRVVDDFAFDDDPPLHAATTTPAPRPARRPIAWRRLRSFDPSLTIDVANDTRLARSWEPPGTSQGIRRGPSTGPDGTAH